jgi:hypothetical protein
MFVKLDTRGVEQYEEYWQVEKEEDGAMWKKVHPMAGADGSTYADYGRFHKCHFLFPSSPLSVSTNHPLNLFLTNVIIVCLSMTMMLIRMCVVDVLSAHSTLKTQIIS